MGNHSSKRPRQPHLFLQKDIEGQPEHYTQEPESEGDLHIDEHPERVGMPTVVASFRPARSNSSTDQSTSPPRSGPTLIYRCPHPQGDWTQEPFRDRLPSGIYYAVFQGILQGIAIVNPSKPNPPGVYLIRSFLLCGPQYVNREDVNAAILDEKAQYWARLNYRAFSSPRDGLLLPKSTVTASLSA